MYVCGEALCTASKIHNCVATQNLELCSMLVSGVALSLNCEPNRDVNVLEFKS